MLIINFEFDLFHKIRRYYVLYDAYHDKRLKKIILDFKITMASLNTFTDAKKVVRKSKQACLNNLCEMIHKKVTSNNGRCHMDTCQPSLMKIRSILIR